MTTRLACSMHRTMFQEADPDMAGKLRGPDLPADVEYGRIHHGLPFPEVADAMSLWESNCRRLQAQLDDDARERESLRKDAAAAGGWAHGELVRIHPFFDGNGRVSRLCLNYFAYRYGLQPFQVIGEKDERYIQVLNWLVIRRDPGPLVAYVTQQMVV